MLKLIMIPLLDKNDLIAFQIDLIPFLAVKVLKIRFFRIFGHVVAFVFVILKGLEVLPRSPLEV